MTATSLHFPAGHEVEPTIPAPRAMSSSRQPRAMADLTLAATSTAVNVGNLFLGYTLREWGHTGLASNGEALMSELIGEAVKLTGVPDPSPRWVELNDLALIRVRLVLLDESMIFEVADRHREPPEPSGTFRSLSTRWNSYPTSVGRVVWCELELPHYELTEHGLP